MLQDINRWKNCYVAFLDVGYFHFNLVAEYDGQSGIQRDCAEVPEGPIDECTLGDIGGMHGTLCYCHGENCNSGDVHTKTTPSPHKLRCLLCGVDEDCFNNPDVDGESTECSDEENMGCYKASVGNWKTYPICSLF